MSKHTLSNKRAAFTEPLSEQQVAKYLSNHPDFWSKYPEILIKQDVIFEGTDDILSFHQYKARKSESDFEALLTEFQEAVQGAYSAQKMLVAFQDIIFHVIAQPRSEWMHILVEQLIERGYADEVHDLRVKASDQSFWHDILGTTGLYCGPYQHTWAQVLKHTPWEPQSCVWLPFRYNRMLFLGHRDPDHFHTDMETVFLHQLQAFLDASQL